MSTCHCCHYHCCHYHCCCQCQCHCITTLPLPLPVPATHAHALKPTLTAPSVEPHPFRSEELSTASGAPDESTLATALPGTGDPRTALQPREPCRPFGRLAMTDGMGRLSGAPPLHLGWVTRWAGQSGEAANARGRSLAGSGTAGTQTRASGYECARGRESVRGSHARGARAPVWRSLQPVTKTCLAGEKSMMPDSEQSMMPASRPARLN